MTLKEMLSPKIWFFGWVLIGSDVQGSSQVPRGGKLEQEQKGLCRFPVRFPVRLELRIE